MKTAVSDSYLIRINPYMEVVETIPFTDSLTVLNQLVGGRFVLPLTLGDHMLLVADNALQEEPYPPAWTYNGHDFLHFGCALIGKLEDNGQFSAATLDPNEVTQLIEWVGFLEAESVILKLDLDGGEEWVEEG